MFSSSGDLLPDRRQNTGETMRKLIWTGLLGVGVLFTAVTVVPFYLSRYAATEGGSCLTLRATPERCKFVGAPLEMAGSPVFVEKFAHAFLPTSKELTFIDSRGDVWTAPIKTLTDGASIPTIFEPIIGDRQSRDYLLAAALHDAFCGVGNEALATFQTRAWEDVHRMFFEALIASGTPPKKAKLMFAAVYLGGPRWDDPKRALDNVSNSDLLRELQWCAEWIDATNPTADEIKIWMQNREANLIAGTSVAPVL
jgi:hypothetical protein